MTTPLRECAGWLYSYCTPMMALWTRRRAPMSSAQVKATSLASLACSTVTSLKVRPPPAGLPWFNTSWAQSCWLPQCSDTVGKTYTRLCSLEPSG